MMYHHTRFKMLGSNLSLVIVLKQKAKFIAQFARPPYSCSTL